MLKLLKYIELPCINTYKRRWVRRIMILISTPQELVRGSYHTIQGAILLWKWDGSVDSNGLPVFKQ
jgi:hypothetical protein